MPVHDYYCARCGQVLVDILVPIAIGQIAGAPQHCGQTTVPIPGIGSMDYGAVKGVGFKSFTTTDGRGNPVTINSLRDLRRVERESEQMARDGVGQPMVWRRWAQEDSNADQPTLSKSYYGGDAPEAAAKHRFGSTLKRSADEPDGSFGPGVDESNASALPLEGGKP
jgi:hypothetical protein